MKPAPFDHHSPTTVAEAIDLLARTDGEAKVLAGGQSLIPILALRLTRFDHLIDLRLIEPLRCIERVDGSLRVGAMTTQAIAESDPDVAAAAALLAAAIPHIGHFQVRNQGTIGGSIAHADPAAELPAVALALDARMEIAGPDGAREVAAQEFFLSTFTTCLDEAELLVAVRFPEWDPGSGFALEEIARRHGDFAIAGAACGLTVTDNRISRAAISMFGMGSTPLRAETVEAALRDTDPADIDLIEVGRTAVRDLDPPDDLHGSPEYRRQIGAVAVTRALRHALQEADRG